MATSMEIEEFMQGPLVTWLKSCLKNSDRLQNYDDLTDGTLIHQVFLLIDPEPVHHVVVPSLRNSHTRIRNLSCIVKNIKVLYEEEYGQLIVALPDCVTLGQKPESKEGLEDMRLLLLLVLGGAVQCPNKHNFIENIKALPVDCQHTLVHCIQQVTDSQEIVLSSENCDAITVDLLLKHVKRLLKERDNYFHLWLSSFDEKRSSISNTVLNNSATESPCQHLAGELADWKTKLRKMRQELEEKSEALGEAKEELERSNLTISKLKSEMQELKQEARVGKAYRDEVDALREKAERCDRLESEVIKYKEKLGDLDYYKSRIEELRQDYRVLEETKEMVEEQLVKAKKRAEYTLKLEGDLVQLKRTIDEITLEKDANQEKLHDLLEENTQLRLTNKANHSNDNSLTINSDNFVQNNLSSNDNSLSEQLTYSAQNRILRLELENKRLLSTVETLQDNAFHRNNERILELEKDKKKLSLQVESLEESKKKYCQQINELETMVKETQSQLKRVQDSYQMLQQQLELRCDDAEFSNKEKIRLKEKISSLTAEIDNLKQNADNSVEITELQNKNNALEKEISKLKRTVEESNISIDLLSSNNENLEKQKEQLLKQIEDLDGQIQKLSDLEKESQELQKQNQIDQVTITNLENDLVSEKLKTQQLKDSLDALGLAIDNVTDPDKVLDKIASNPEVLKVVRERLAEEQPSDSNAKLQVNIITLQSQISSLTSQHTALQLANSQLVAEKEEALKELSKLTSAHQQLIEDQNVLQRLHNQLNSEYDSLVEERETLKNNLKDTRAEKRSLQEKYMRLKATCNGLEAEKENFKKDSESLINLRTEHSKLKEDFRNLFTASEKLKIEYRLLQDEYKKVRSEAGRMKVTVTELQGQLSASSEKILSLELEISKLTNKCELLMQVNSGLEEDRRSLMDHVTLLLSQYHELLTQSMEDKEHYHSEEKLFADKVNNLRRQKEKLEEKIMEHYRKSENCSIKKKSFGASIVRRVKKAGSELINKSRKSVHEESVDRRATDSDTSTEDSQSKQAARDMDDNLSCLSIPGTRRTVYLSGNETVDGDDTSTGISVNGQEDFNKMPSIDNARSSTPYQDLRPPLLVYNRLTAKVGGKITPSPSPTPSQHSNKESSTQSAENVKNAVWYEYGCV
ncbi:girdin [Planococcus citri]|uniref:girdin n=1 Tax=Planococcus citri TaxID=170843 RepID=UPI0031FA04BD